MGVELTGGSCLADSCGLSPGLARPASSRWEGCSGEEGGGSAAWTEEGVAFAGRPPRAEEEASLSTPQPAWVGEMEASRDAGRGCAVDSFDGSESGSACSPLLDSM